MNSIIQDAYYFIGCCDTHFAMKRGEYVMGNYNKLTSKRVRIADKAVLVTYCQPNRGFGINDFDSIESQILQGATSGELVDHNEGYNIKWSVV